MKTRNILIALSLGVFATLNAMAADAMLSPRAADTQIKKSAGYNEDPNLTATGPVSNPPHIFDTQIKTVAGKSDAASPSLTCTRKMSGSPKQIGECADHPAASMSCCSAPVTKMK